MKSTLIAAAAALTLVLSGAPALAHTQSVTPPGQEDAVVSGPVSKPWAQAHCQAAAPQVHEGHAVVQFLPAENLPCLDTTLNPGGQSHPNAVTAP